MCKDCFNLETNTGLVIYSGVDLTLCDNVKITNGEDMTSVVNKIKSCLDFINSEIDITGLTSSTECLDLTGDTLKDILQSIINQTGSCCCEVSSLQDQIDAINAKLNGTGAITKTTAITYCNPASVTKTSTSTQDTYKVNHGFVPPNTILPYFGSLSDFDNTGLGKNNMKGWGIANGLNGTINACGNFIRYECTICCNGTGGSDTATLSKLNIPELTLPEVKVTIDVTGETNEAGKHAHKMRVEYEEGGDSCVDVRNPADNEWGDDPDINRGLETAPSSDCGPRKQMGYAGLHKHTFTGKGEGKLNGIEIGEENPQSFSIVPKHLKAIPIQWIGQC
jgi:hypothetical protein